MTSINSKNGEVKKKEYWVVNCEGLSQDNQDVLNLFLRSLKEMNKNKQTVMRYRAALQSFFLAHPVSYKSMTERGIEAWLLDLRKHRNGRTVNEYLKTIRAFYNFCVQEKYLSISPLNVDHSSVSSPERYWELQTILPNQDNHNVLNLFLQSLKEKNKSKQTVTRYRGALQSFFLARPVSYKLLTEERIKAWLLELRENRNERTVNDYLKTIRAFCDFCVLEKYLDISPLDVNHSPVSSPDRYWELQRFLPNQDNQLVINQFLLHLRNIGRPRKSIVTIRSFLQRFFLRRDQPYHELTLEEIEQWMIGNQHRWSAETLRCTWSALRALYEYCWEKGILDDPPLRSKRRLAEAMDLYWEVKGRFAVADNKRVINEYLLHLKNKNRSKETIVEYSIMLTCFFGDSPVHFSQIDRKQIDEWFSCQNPDWSTMTIKSYRTVLRTFFFFCVRKEYIAQSPIHYFWLEKNASKKYWESDKVFANMTNKEVVNEYLQTMKLANMSELTIRLYKNTLEKYFALKEEDFSTVSTDEVLQWVIQQQKNVVATTVNGRLSILSSFFRFCVEEEYIKCIPIKNRWFMREPKPLPRYLEREELAKVRQSAEKEALRNRIMVEFLLSSGCRISELHRLDKSDVDVENRTARVMGKGSKIREVHFSETCALLLTRYLGTKEVKEEEHPALLVSEIGTRLGISRMRKIINKLGETAQITESLYPHRFRHTFATELLIKGAELDFIADELGHASLDTTKIYARLPQWKLIRLYRRYMG